EEMSGQVVNFNDIAGFSNLQKKWRNLHSEFISNPNQYLKDNNTYNSVRKEAAQLRASLAGHALSAPEINSRVLNEVIRPVMKTFNVPSEQEYYNVEAPIVESRPVILPGAYERNSENPLAAKPWYLYTEEENDLFGQDEFDNYNENMRNTPINKYWEWGRSIIGR
ncbi:MAG: hypothetical protein AB1394_17370, partial [Bacteroidota bacterium]